MIPLRMIDEASEGLANGKLEHQLDYHSEDELGILAHNLRKSIKVLQSYVMDIGSTMNEFSKGNFAVQPAVQWKGDFINIKDSVVAFEKASDVTEGSQKIAENVSQIAMASEEQAEAIAEINTGVESINEVVQTNSATSEECAAASQEMTG